MPTNYSTGGNPNDTFPPDSPQVYSASLSVFNGTDPNGTWSLYVVDDAAGDHGSMSGGWTLGVDTTAFSNTDPITVPSVGSASPYPSQISVFPGLGHVRNVRATLRGLSHTFPDDLDILLVGPQGQKTILMSDCGGSDNLSGVNLTFDDLGTPLPDGTQITSGLYHPTNRPSGSDFNDTFPPDPAQVYSASLDVFNNTIPDGTWSLKVVDDNAVDSGSISGGWFLDFDPEPAILANISTRLRVETGDNVLIGGFIVTGTQPKKVIVRAIGPSLSLLGKLSDPTLELRDGSGALIWFNDDWHDGAQGFPSQEAEIIATTIPPTSNTEAAIVATLPANNSTYTAIVRGFNNTTGIALVEAYDLDTSVNSKLANISTRGLVQTGDNVMIAGTIVPGAFSQKVIIRAIGPSLSVPGKLADPILELRNSVGTLLRSNDNWRDTQEADIIATTIPPTNDLESAIVVVLPSRGASYTATVRGANGATGVAVVEVYALQ